MFKKLVKPFLIIGAFVAGVLGSAPADASAAYCTNAYYYYRPTNQRIGNRGYCQNSGYAPCSILPFYSYFNTSQGRRIGYRDYGCYYSIQ